MTKYLGFLALLQFSMTAHAAPPLSCRPLLALYGPLPPDLNNGFVKLETCGKSAKNVRLRITSTLTAGKRVQTKLPQDKYDNLVKLFRERVAKAGQATCRHTTKIEFNDGKPSKAHFVCAEGKDRNLVRSLAEAVDSITPR